MAFELLVDKYQKPVYNLAFRMTKSYDDSKDITQNVFLKAYEKLNSYKSSYKFFSWLYRIAINETLNYIQSRKPKDDPEPNQASENGNPETVLTKNEISAKLQDMLLVIDIDYRLVLVMKHFMNFSYEEIGELLQIPGKTVKSRLYTARQLLKNLLIKRGFEDND